MYLFWEPVISRIFSTLQPKNIVEIGSDHGDNTKNILDYCKKNNALLHVIDPLPKYDETEWQKEYGELLVFHKTLSLSALSQIEKMDAVLIDGDHNWYTVFNELKLIEKNAMKHKTNFPIIFLHDIGWPYGRRDLYYNPDNIPEAYRQPYKKKGIIPGQPDLTDNGGLNPHLFNAIYENNLHNGVLTAVEDFLKDTDENIQLIKIPALYGLGILYPEKIIEKLPELGKLLEDFTLSDSVLSLIDVLEKSKITSEISSQEQKNLHQILNKKLSAKEHQLQESSEIANKLQVALVEQEERIVEQSSAINELESKLTSKEQQRQESSEAASKLQTALDEQEERLAEQGTAINELESKLTSKDQQLQEYRDAIKKSQSESYELGRWMEQIAHDHEAFMDSWRWKVGDTSVRSVEKIMGRPRVKLTVDHIGEILKDFIEWKKVKKSPSVIERAFSANKKILAVKGKKYEPVPVTNKISIDIVVCVHNALSDVKKCLNSIIEDTTANYKLYIINDGSNDETSYYLKNFSKNNHSCILIENKNAQGYTKSANKGLRQSNGEYVILLNSDTVVTTEWIQKIIECGESNQKVGIIGPLSNSATWQSVPDLVDKSTGTWALNLLPSCFDVDMMAAVVSNVSKKVFPIVPFINGFCYVIKRCVIKKIGLLDEESFPRGYGEEDDYTLRAINSGFICAVADNLYVYHAKSRSFGSKTRSELVKIGQENLKRKHGADRIKELAGDLRDNIQLRLIRERIQEKLKEINNNNNLKLTIIFLLPISGNSGLGGGAHSVVQETIGLRKEGYDAKIAIKKKAREAFESHYKEYVDSNNLFYIYDNDDDIVEYAKTFRIVIATAHYSIPILEKICAKSNNVIPFYYVQDFEPYFHTEGTKEYDNALKSYSSIQTVTCFAKTKWICEIVNNNTGIKVKKVIPSLDRKIYSTNNIKKENSVVTISAMVRTSSVRRAPQRTMSVLKRIKNKFGDTVKIEIFGSQSNELDSCKEISKDFSFTNHGPLPKIEVAKLLQNSDIFVDFSDFQAFGRTALEAMACGCAVVLPSNGGTQEFAVHENNSLMVDTRNEDDCYNSTQRLITDNDLRCKLIKNGTKKSFEFDSHKAALYESRLFRRIEYERLTSQGEKVLSLSFLIPHQKKTTGGVYTIIEHAKNLGYFAKINILVMEESCEAIEGINVIKINKIDSENIPDADFLIVYGDSPHLQDLEKLPPHKGKIIFYIQSFSIRTENTIANIRSGKPVITCSKWLYEKSKTYSKAVYFVPHGLDYNIFHPGPPQRKRKKTISFMTHYNEIKGCQDGIKALQIVKKAHPDTTIYLFGNTPVNDTSDFIFLKEPSRNEIADLLRESAVYVCSSLEEGFGLTGLEAMACGSALATTDTKGGRDYAFHNYTALVSTPGNPEILAKNIILLLENEELREAIANKGHEFTVTNYFPWEIACMRFERALNVAELWSCI